MHRKAGAAIVAAAAAMQVATVPALAAAKTYAGSAVSTRYGTVQVWITVSGRRITNLSYSLPTDRPRSVAIDRQAGPKLKSEALAAQSANIHSVSGATTTSDAFKQSLQAALGKAHI